MNASLRHPKPRPSRPAHARAGNSLVLVTALLVLLVIVATAYLGRARGERVITAAQQQSVARDMTVSAIADDLAREVTEALFVRPLPSGVPPWVPPRSAVPDESVFTSAPLTGPQTTAIAGSNQIRLDIPPDAVRYGRDRPGYSYNHAPHHVVPFTNWPDGDQRYPRGPNNRDGAVLVIGSSSTGFPGIPLGEFNPPGNPGSGDLRWLRDPEPVRIDVRQLGLSPTDYGLSADDELFVYSHWRKMSNIARPENGWRMVADISNALDSLVLDLSIPVEQWLAYPFPGMGDVRDPRTVLGDQPGRIRLANASSANFFTSFGTRQINFGAFEPQWGTWLGNHPTALHNVNFIPNNLYRLSDLNADGNWITGTNPPRFQPTIGERPEDEFNGPGTLVGGPSGTARWMVSRILADSDGDGFTDAFWFLSPYVVDGRYRQVVAISIVDNAGMVNVNTATRFVRSGADTATTGTTPADVALVGQNVVNTFGNELDNWNSGLFDTFLNQSRPGEPFFRGAPVAFSPLKWAEYQTSFPTRPQNFLSALGVVGNLPFHGTVDGALALERERLRYFRAMGAGYAPETVGLSPFGIADESELRRNRATNDPTTLSALEAAVDLRRSDPLGGGFAGAAGQRVLLRSEIGVPGADPNVTVGLRAETSDWLDRLTVPDLARDVRSRITTHNATRNDLMPPWLWPSRSPDEPWFRFRGIRETFLDTGLLPSDPAFLPVEAVNLLPQDWERAIRKVDLRRPILSEADRIEFQADVQNALERAFASVQRNPLEEFGLCPNEPPVIANTIAGNYPTGDTPGPFGWQPGEETLMIARSFAANIVASRRPAAVSVPARVPAQVTALPIWANTPAANQDVRYFPGVHEHPFIVQAFVAHDYPGFRVPEGYPNAGDWTVFRDAAPTPSSPNPGESDLSRTIVAVQIANPYKNPISLIDYELELFGQRIPLRNLAYLPFPLVELGSSAVEFPPVLTLYLIEGGGEFESRWLDFLDIRDTGFSVAPYLALPSANTVSLRNIPGFPGGPALPTGDDLPPPPALPPQAFDVSLSRNVYDTYEGPSIRLVRVETWPFGPNEPGTPAWPADGDLWRIPVDSIDTVSRDFAASTRAMAGVIPPEAPDSLPPFDQPYPVDTAWEIPTPDSDPFAASREYHWVQWRWVGRGFGIPNGDSQIRENPRYVFAQTRILRAEDAPEPDGTGGAIPPPFDLPNWNPQYLQQGNHYDFADRPDGPGAGAIRPWFVVPRLKWSPDPDVDEPVSAFGKPAVFNLNPGPINPADGAFPSVPQTGVYHRPYPIQLLSRRSDFTRLDDLSYVWLRGPMVRVRRIADGGGGVDPTTNFELVVRNPFVAGGTPDAPFGTFAHILERSVTSSHGNRIAIPQGNAIAGDIGSQMIDVRDPRSGRVGGGPCSYARFSAVNYASLDPSIPALPAAARVFEAFTLDGPGDGGNDDVMSLAAGFSGRGVQGLINVNTASPQVLRTLPHLYRLTHRIDSPSLNPRSRFGEAIVSYRDRTGSWSPSYPPNLPDLNEFNNFLTPLPNYAGRGEGASQITTPPLTFTGYLPSIRAERGIAAVGELLLLDRPATDTFDQLDPIERASLRRTFAARNPFDSGNANISTDAGPFREYDNVVGPDVPRERFEGDMVQQNLLFAGIGNLVTTRSDTFTVHFKVRTFRQDPVTGRWDALKRENIVDDSRYVMVVDRSEVNRPADRPRILFIEKVPTDSR